MRDAELTIVQGHVFLGAGVASEPGGGASSPKRGASADVSVMQEEQRAATRPPFIGRNREIAELEAAIEDAFAGSGRLFLVSGEAGAGKTRLADEIAFRAGARGMTAVWGRAWEAGGAPAYWPWIHALRSLVATFGAGVVADKVGAGAGRLWEILPELRRMPGLEIGVPPASDSASARFYFFDAVATLLARLAADRPVLVVLDDLHAADRPSLLLLQFVARAVAKSRLIVMATAREFEVRSEPETARLFDEIARDGTWLTLGGLGLEDTGALIEASLGTSPAPDLVRSVHAMSDGNPYCVAELSRLIRAEARGRSAIGRRSFRLPANLRGAIGRRLDSLGAECRRVLAIAAVSGRDFALATLRQVSGLAETPLLDVLAEAERVGLVHSSTPDGRRRAFTHALVREALYGELSPAQRASLHREIGETLERVHAANPAPRAAEIAHHFFEAARGGLAVDEAIDHQRRAGARAVALLAYEEGEVHYRRALELLEVTRSNDALRGELLLEIGGAATKGGNLSGARAAFAEAAASARRAGTAEQLARAAIGVGVPWLDPTIVDVERVALLEEALAALGDAATELRARVLCRLALALYWQPGSAARRDALSREAVDIARRIDDPATLAYALEARHYALWDPDHVEERLVAATEMARVADRLQAPDVALAATSWRLLDLLEIGDVEAMGVEVVRRVRLADELRQPLQRSLAIVTKAMRAIVDGRFAAAERLAEEARALGIAAQPDGTEIRFVCQMLPIRREQGRAAEMEQPLHSLLERYPRLVAFRCGLAALYADLGRRGEARAELELVAANEFADLPRDVTWYANLAYLTDACVFLGDVPRARLLYDLALPYAERNLAIAAGLAGLGSVSRLLGRLAVVLSRREDAARHFAAALERNERMGARPWVAHVQREYADVLSASGTPEDRARADDLRRRALATARELGMRQLAESLSRAMGPAPLGRVLDFRREGESWVVGFNGELRRFRDGRGIRSLAHLVRHPEVDFVPGDLAAAIDGEAEVSRAADASAEQMRVNLTKAIKAAIDKIEDGHPRLGEHLRDAIRTGKLFRYTGALALLAAW